MTDETFFHALLARPLRYRYLLPAAKAAVALGVRGETDVRRVGDALEVAVGGTVVYRVRLADLLDTGYSGGVSC